MNKHLTTATAYISLATALLFAQNADAKTWLRANGAICNPGVDQWNEPNEWNYSFGRLRTRGDSVCPLLEQNGLQRDDLTKGSFWVKPSQNTTLVQACRMSLSGTSGVCGTPWPVPSGTSSRKISLTSLDTSAWSNTSGTAYFLTRSSGTYEVNGYYIENNNSSVLTSSFRSQAAWCRPEDDSDWNFNLASVANPNLDGGPGLGAEESGFFAAQDSQLICPLIEQSGIQRDDIGFGIYGEDRSPDGNIDIELCRRSYSGTSYCGASNDIYEEVEGDSTVIPPIPDVPERGLLDDTDLDTSKWSNTTGTAYIKVNMPPDTNNFWSTFQGFRVY